MHDLTIIFMLTGALTSALALGWLTQRLGLSPLVGYLLAGIVVGPYTPGFVAEPELATQLAEIGVILLMFGVGLHFHPEELLRVWRVAVPGAVSQSVVATVLGYFTARGFGWTTASGLVLGMSLAVASTVVLMRMLIEQNRIDTRDGHVTVGWLIVEDIFTVIALVLLPQLVFEGAVSEEMVAGIAIALAKVGAFALLAWTLGPRLLSPVLEAAARTRSAELFTLAVFVVALGIATLASAAFEVSVALGAFLAGLVVGRSRVGHQAGADVQPFRDVFSALFFVSVGMLFNPAFALQNWAIILAVLAIVLLAKPAIALVVVALLRQPRRVALTVAVGLAQVGEFSFILAALGRSLGVLPQAGFDSIVAGALLSIAVNPLLFKFADRIDRRFMAAAPLPVVRQDSAPQLLRSTPSVVVVGFGEVGRRLCPRLADAGILFSILESDMDAVEAARGEGFNCLYGDAGRPEILRSVGVERAGTLVLTPSLLAAKMSACVAARALSPDIRIVARAANPGEQAWLKEFGAAEVCDDSLEIGLALFRSITHARRPSP